jgi:hypothetical protein
MTNNSKKLNLVSLGNPVDSGLSWNSKSQSGRSCIPKFLGHKWIATEALDLTVLFSAQMMIGFKRKMRLRVKP